MNNQISARQLCAAGFAGLLSLFAGAWVDWRGAVLAVPVVVLSMCAALYGARQAGGLLKNPGGRPMALLYIVWGVFLAGTALALCGQRMSEAGGQGGPFWPTILTALPVFWLAAGKPEAFARAAEIFYLALLAVLAFIFLLGVKQVEGRWLLAAGEDLGPSVLTAAGLGCCGVYAVLLWNDVTFLGLVLQCCRGLWRDVLGLRGEKWAGLAFAAASMGTALCLGAFGRPEELLKEVIPLGGLISGGVLPVLLWTSGRRQKAPEAEAIFGGPEGPEAHVFGDSEGLEKKS